MEFGACKGGIGDGKFVEMLEFGGTAGMYGECGYVELLPLENVYEGAKEGAVGLNAFLPFAVVLILLLVQYSK